MFSYGAYVQCSISILQGCHPVPLVMSDLLMETGRWREEWKCVVMERREQYMTLLDGVSVMLKSHVHSVDTLQSVS